jgi:hypothetical protein
MPPAPGAFVFRFAYRFLQGDFSLLVDERAAVLVYPKPHDLARDNSLAKFPDRAAPAVWTPELIPVDCGLDHHSDDSYSSLSIG